MRTLINDRKVMTSHGMPIDTGLYPSTPGDRELIVTNILETTRAVPKLIL